MNDEAKDLTDDAATADEASKADVAQEEAVASALPGEEEGIGESEANETQASGQSEADLTASEKKVEEAAAEEGEAVAEEVEDEEGEVEEAEDEAVEEEEEEEHVPEPPAPELTAEEQAAELAAQMDWYILKVQSNRENSIVDALHRRVAVAGLEPYFGEVIVPVEMVTEFKAGKKKVVKRKLYPGYIVVQMVVTEDTWFLVRETPGVGDFTGAGGKPTPMSPQDVEKIRPKVEADTSDSPRLKIDFKPTDKVKINDGTFENFEGEVATIDEASGRVSVMINIFGRSTPVELEYWQVEKV